MRNLKLFFLITACTAFTTTYSQDIADNAIGLRLGESDGFGAEISYQRALTSSRRLEINLGWRDSRELDAIKLTGLYQWVLPIEGGLQWYYGVGGGLGSVDFEPRVNINNQIYTPDGGLFIFGAGDVGIEYSFDFPLQISLDFRPELGLIGYGGFDQLFFFDFGLGFRYQF